MAANDNPTSPDPALASGRSGRDDPESLSASAGSAAVRTGWESTQSGATQRADEGEGMLHLLVVAGAITLLLGTSGVGGWVFAGSLLLGLKVGAFSLAASCVGVLIAYAASALIARMIDEEERNH